MGAKGTVQATWSGLSAGSHFYVARKKLSVDQRDGRARPVPAAPARGRRARAGDKDNSTKKWQLQKALYKRRHQGDINCGPSPNGGGGEERERTVSLFIWIAAAEK